MSMLQIKQFLYAPDGHPWALILILGISFVLGAIHALAPGHGKSLMAAYLVGSQGRIRDAVTVSLSLTVSHVFSVVIIGLLAMLLMDFFFLNNTGVWFSFFSGVGILMIGIWLFFKRFETLRSSSSYLNITEDTVAHNQIHGHPEHEHHHLHSNSGDHHHHHSIPSEFSFREDVVLGISGGIVPCPKAVVIMLLAISLHRVLLGITVIAAFSLGLATTLMITGVLLLKASDLVIHRFGERNLMIIPLMGTLIIIGLGAYLTYLTLTAGGILG